MVAAGLAMFVAGISLVVWKSGWFPALPEKQAAPPSTQSPAPPPTQVAPSPQGSPSSQALAPTKVVPVPERTDQALVAPLSKGPSPTPMAPSPNASPPPRVLPQIQRNGISGPFKRLDKNKDGKVSFNEFMNWREAQFNRLDANNDGSLRWLEILDGGNRFDLKIKENFSKIDTNQDQMLSREEFRDASRRRFLTLDANRDGSLSENELVDSHDSSIGRQ